MPSPIECPRVIFRKEAWLATVKGIAGKDEDSVSLAVLGRAALTVGAEGRNGSHGLESCQPLGEEALAR